ncbi:hypothetical protein BDZ94DRAFT_1244758 [Collybia nuda]|uniref:Uncharacterized protein n=1 Tax=Collybia nuda TaxID=64659 RepID=A0A9P5YJ96_9AGAR|nr:hypothetical protein BDZ94DRAFT_1244758 [Collybia nuda]
MSFTNINDPAGVKALLDQLRVSQAWQDITTSSLPEPDSPSANIDERANVPAPPAVSTATSASVASLLSQLQASSSPSIYIPNAPSINTHKRSFGWPTIPSQQLHGPAPPLLSEAALPSTRKDTSSYTFQQALPHIAQLADDPKFVEAIRKMKDEQDKIERQLWEDRRAIYKKYEEKVKVATTKATITGDGKISKHEAEMIHAAFKKDLEKFDRESVLLAWDGLISKQQVTLAQHGVPTMFTTNQGKDRERQQRVMQVLEGIL